MPGIIGATHSRPSVRPPASAVPFCWASSGSSSIRLLVTCVEELLEKSLPAEVEEKIRQEILSFPGVTAPHHLRTRRIGSNYSIEVHIRMDGRITLEEAHRTATAIENRLKSEFGSRTYINIHVEPVK